MTTNNPEVQAILVTCVDKDGETILSRGVRLIENHDPSCVNVNWNYEPLVRLSDYESLKEELESLKEYAELGKAVQQKREPDKRYGCHCDLDEGMKPDGCVIDEGNRHQCIYAKHITTKEQCEYWQVIVSDENLEENNAR